MFLMCRKKLWWRRPRLISTLRGWINAHHCPCRLLGTGTIGNEIKTFKRNPWTISGFPGFSRGCRECSHASRVSRCRCRRRAVPCRAGRRWILIRRWNLSLYVKGETRRHCARTIPLWLGDGNLHETTTTLHHRILHTYIYSVPTLDLELRPIPAQSPFIEEDVRREERNNNKKNALTQKLTLSDESASGTPPNENITRYTNNKRPVV